MNKRIVKTKNKWADFPLSTYKQRTKSVYYKCSVCNCRFEDQDKATKHILENHGTFTTWNPSRRRQIEKTYLSE